MARAELSVTVRTNADLAAAVGERLATLVRAWRRDTWQRLPRAVHFYREKPKFWLNDGQTLDAHAVDLVAGEQTGEVYCGSGDTAVMHRDQQLGEGGAPADGQALIFVETHWNGRNMSWTLHVVTPSFARQVTA